MLADPSQPIQIDGAHGEGGGQILRTCLALSLRTGRPFQLSRVRHNRENAGRAAAPRLYPKGGSSSTVRPQCKGLTEDRARHRYDPDHAGTIR
jgi:RNA 3'-terminal phosphate cyclase